MISQVQCWPRIHRKGDFPEYKAILTSLFQHAGGRSCLDLGCGEAHVTQNFAGAVLVDSVVRQNPRVPVIAHDMTTWMDIPSLQHRRFDLLFMGDSIEHLRRQSALDLLTDSQRYCRAMAIFTPVGPWHMDEESTDPDAHKSAWHPEEFSAAGWSVVEYPSYHRYEAGEQLGAFWAWSWMAGARTPTPEEIYAHAGVSLP